MNKRRTAKNKLNGAYFNGALVVAGLLGAATGSWGVFLITTCFLIAVNINDGSIRL